MSRNKKNKCFQLTIWGIFSTLFRVCIRTIDISCLHYL